jgi:protoheme IX farnesyltransferase
MLLYTGLMVGVSFILVPVADLRWIYLSAALVLGAWFVWDTWRVYNEPGQAMRLFTTSTVYLASLFGAVLVDVIVR